MEGVVWCASKILAAIDMSILYTFRIAGRISDSRLCSPSDSPIFETRKMKGDKNSTCGKYFPGSQICLRLPQLRRAVSFYINYGQQGQGQMNWRCASTVSCVVLTSNYGHDSNWWFHYLLKVIHAIIISKGDVIMVSIGEILLNNSVYSQLIFALTQANWHP